MSELEKLVGPGPHNVALGESCRKSRDAQGMSNFHTIKYDFKPASVDATQPAAVDVGKENNVTVTLPHVEGKSESHTMFKGSKKPYNKECVLIIDHDTGSITLERLGMNIQLKKTRAEGSSKVGRPQTPTLDAKPSKSAVPATNCSTSKAKQYARKERHAIDDAKTLNHGATKKSKHHSVASATVAASTADKTGSSSESSASSSCSSDSDMEVVESYSDGDAASHSKKKLNSLEINQLRQDLQLSESGSDSD